MNAMRDYQAAILMDVNYGLAYYNSSNILLLHSQYAQAVQHLNTAIEVCGMRDESTLQNRAIAQALMGDLSGAFRDLCEALKHSGYAAHIYMNRALLLCRMENFSLAEKDLSTGRSPGIKYTYLQISELENVVPNLALIQTRMKIKRVVYCIFEFQN